MLETGVYFSIIFNYSLRITLRVFQKEVKRLSLNSFWNISYVMPYKMIIDNSGITPVRTFRKNLLNTDANVNPLKRMVQYFIGFKLTHICWAICIAAQFMTQLLDVLDFSFPLWGIVWVFGGETQAFASPQILCCQISDTLCCQLSYIMQDIMLADRYYAATRH